MFGIGLSTSCTNHTTNSFPVKEYFDGAINIRTPKNWAMRPLPDVWRYDPRDTVFTTLIGSGKQEAQITVRHQKYMNIEDISSRITLDAYYKSRSSAKILSVTTDSVHNKIVVDFLAEYEGRKPLIYFRNVVLIQGRKWVYVEFHGPNSKALRDTVQQMTESIQVHSR